MKEGEYIGMNGFDYTLHDLNQKAALVESNDFSEIYRSISLRLRKGTIEFENVTGERGSANFHSCVKSWKIDMKCPTKEEIEGLNEKLNHVEILTVKDEKEFDGLFYVWIRSRKSEFK